MTKKRTYQIPDFLVQDLNDGQSFSAPEVQELETIFSSAEAFQYPEASTEAQWQTLRSKLTPMTVVKEPTRVRQFAMFKWAAAAVVVLSVSIGIWQSQKNKVENFTAIYKTGNHKQLVKLPDGTSINLNTNSELEVKTMNDEDRVVALHSGEAFFNVIHNELPFKVETSKGEITVTGTEFNIKNRKELPFAVFLKTGKVKFKSGTASLDMRPGQCLKENAKGFELSTADNSGQFAWIDNKLVFNSQPLSEIVKELEVTYKVKFIYDQKLAGEKYNLVCDNNLNATQVAELLTKVTNSKVRIE
jgi:transmembrane sensor